MKRSVCMSMGSFYQKRKKHYSLEGMDNAIKICSKLDIDGVEILFGDAEKLLKFKLDDEQIRILNKFRFNTIHLPFKFKEKELLFKKDNLTKRILKKAYNIYDKIDAKNINIHPTQISDYKIFDKRYNYSIENMEIKDGLKIKDYKNILSQNKNFRFVLDTTHASEAGELKDLIKNFRRDIIYLHLSANYFNHLHIPLHVLKEEYIKYLYIIKRLNVPFIIEDQIGTETIREYEKEVNFVRKWLKD